MKRYAKVRSWFIVSLMLSLLATGFLANTPKASAMTRSSYILFWVPADKITHLQVEGNNQYDRNAVWSQSYSTPASYPITGYGNTHWWWNGTITISFTTQNLGSRRCIIDNLNTASQEAIVSYTPGFGCSGDTGDTPSWDRTVEEMNNYMEHDQAYQIVDAADGAINKMECLQGIAEDLSRRIPVMTIVACGGAALNTINQILQACCHATLNTGNSGSTSGHWTIRIFNMDDSGIAYLNRDWNNAVAQATYGSDTGWVDITSRMTAGNNSLVFGNWNDAGGYTWGFQVAYNGQIVWSSQSGQQGVYGANNNDMSRSHQWTDVEWLVLHPDGTVTPE